MVSCGIFATCQHNLSSKSIINKSTQRACKARDALGNQTYPPITYTSSLTYPSYTCASSNLQTEPSTKIRSKTENWTSVVDRDLRFTGGDYQRISLTSYGFLYQFLFFQSRNSGCLACRSDQSLQHPYSNEHTNHNTVAYANQYSYTHSNGYGNTITNRYLHTYALSD